MQKRTAIAFILVGVLSTVPTTIYAADTPSSHTSPSSAHTKQSLTPAQKEAISAAKAAFAIAKSNAQNGFDRAIADAQAIRDQAISSAGNDSNSIRLAKKNYIDSYKMILRVYTSDMNQAKLALKNALAAVRPSK